jgi:hypothetical protein
LFDDGFYIGAFECLAPAMLLEGGGGDFAREHDAPEAAATGPSEGGLDGSGWRSVMDDVCVALSSVPARLLEAHRKIDLLKSVFEVYKTELVASAKAHVSVAATGASVGGDGGGGGGGDGRSPRRRGRAGRAGDGHSGGGGGGGGHSSIASSGVTARIISPSEALGMVAELGDITWRWTRSVRLICSEQLSSEVG